MLSHLCCDAIGALREHYLARVNTWAALCSLLLTSTQHTHAHTPALCWSQHAVRQERREEGLFAALRASCRFAQSSVLSSPSPPGPGRSMGLQSRPPSTPPLSAMACLDVESPSLCRGQFKSGDFLIFFNILFSMLWFKLDRKSALSGGIRGGFTPVHLYQLCQQQRQQWRSPNRKWQSNSFKAPPSDSCRASLVQGSLLSGTLINQTPLRWSCQSVRRSRPSSLLLARRRWSDVMLPLL